MEYADWEGLYREILEDFGFSRERDEEAARLLDSLLEDVDVGILEDIIRGQSVSVFGAGPSLEGVEDFPDGPKIAADGAASYLMEKGIVPDIVVTDLDGRMEDLLEAAGRGAVVVVHAHGDNMDRLKAYVPQLVGRGTVVGTCQCRPVGRVRNFGGFTDGDRCVFLACHFGARKIALYGMDFKAGIGRYSFSADTALKRKKLAWAENLVSLAMDESKRGMD
ncbi:MAG: DUF115 domain-containing protein [Euryarchaeota archaeon]|nr:DUF115 domain-containing protein [Euryarchaeota archaeon]